MSIFADSYMTNVTAAPKPGARLRADAGSSRKLLLLAAVFLSGAAVAAREIGEKRINKSLPLGAAPPV